MCASIQFFVRGLNLRDLLELMAQCRICYEGSTFINPLISVCECKGSVEFSHTRCLIKWIKTTENESFRSICEMCMSPYTFVHKSYISSPKPAILWGFFGNKFMLISWTFLIHSLLYIAAMTHPNPSFPLQLCRNSNFVFSTEIVFLTTIYACFYAPLVYNMEAKALYFFHWLNPWPYRQRLREKRPALVLCLTLFSFLTSFYYMYAGGIMYLILLPELYNTHKVIVRTMRPAQFLEDE
jgi:hypothetical protein